MGCGSVISVAGARNHAPELWLGSVAGLCGPVSRPFPPLVLLLAVLSCSCPPLVLFLTSSCRPPVLSFCPVLVVWLRWPTLRRCPPRAAKPCVFLPLLLATFSNPVGPPGVPRCPRATVANPVSFFCCLSRSACPACPRCGPFYHRATRGLSHAWPCRFSYLRRLVWVCFHVAMNATGTQRSKCDITIGSSHDIYRHQELAFSNIYCFGRFHQHLNFRG